MTLLILRYVAAFFFLTTLATSGLAVYRGEVISKLQSEKIGNQQQEIKVIIDTTELASKVGNEVQTKLNSIETSREKTVHEVERIIKEPIYLSTCFTPAGMSQLHEAISAPVASESEQSVQRNTATK